MERTSETKPVTIVAIGAGNRTNKYLEYAIRNPDRLKLVGVAELNDIRRHAVASKFGLKPEECFTDYERFFENPVPADAILIGTPENMHFEPCMKAIEAGYNVLLEKPIAQSLPECCRIAEAARRKGVIVGVCHVLRYHPYFIKIKEIVDSGQLGEIISISHLAAVETSVQLTCKAQSKRLPGRISRESLQRLWRDFCRKNIVMRRFFGRRQ